MGDHMWEVVGGQKKKTKGPKVNANNGQIPGVKWSSVGPASAPAPPVQMVQTTKKGKKVKHKGPRDYKVAPLPNLESDSDEHSSDRQTEGASQRKDANAKAPAKKSIPRQHVPVRKEGLENALKKIPDDELLRFFFELKSAGSVGDVYLSWIKYSADALNTRLSPAHVTTPDPSQFPNDLFFPKCPTKIIQAVQQIIGESAEFNPNVDIIGSSYSLLLASLPTLLQRGDSGWGYLIFLREMCHLYPDLPLRRMKTVMELMESYGNRKEVGLCILWAISQSALFSSDCLLKIVVDFILPYYNFKHYKSFVLSALTTISVNVQNIATVDDMAGGDTSSVIDPDHFIEFFDTAFDPKKRRDFEKFYVEIRNFALHNIKGNGAEIFIKLLPRLGKRDFLPMSHEGKETFEILNGCIANDLECLEVWKLLLSNFPRESLALLNYLSKNAENVNYSKQLESIFIQSDEFASAAVKNPELIRGAKKLQTGIKRAEAERSKRGGFSWKWLFLVLIAVIGGLLYLDIAENGRGVFAKSKTGRILKDNGLLESTELIVEKCSKASAQAFNAVATNLRPVLQTVGDQAQVYIPQALEYGKAASNITMEYAASAAAFLKNDVFVGALAPENLRNIAKETLSTMWSFIYLFTQQVYRVIEKYIN